MVASLQPRHDMTACGLVGFKVKTKRFHQPISSPQMYDSLGLNGLFWRLGSVRRSHMLTESVDSISKSSFFLKINSRSKARWLIKRWNNCTDRINDKLYEKNCWTIISLFVWLWLVVNDRKFLAGTVFFSHINQPAVLLHESATIRTSQPNKLHVAGWMTVQENNA